MDVTIVSMESETSRIIPRLLLTNGFSINSVPPRIVDYPRIFRFMYTYRTYMKDHLFPYKATKSLQSASEALLQVSPLSEMQGWGLTCTGVCLSGGGQRRQKAGRQSHKGLLSHGANSFQVSQASCAGNKGGRAGMGRRPSQFKTVRAQSLAPLSAASQPFTYCILYMLLFGFLCFC